MNTNQVERIAAQRAMTQDQQASAWAFRNGANSIDLQAWFREKLYSPVILLDVLFPVFYVLMYFLSPLDMSHHSTAAGKLVSGPTPTQMFVCFSHFMFICGMAGYVFDVVAHVPWRSLRSPLVATTHVYPIRYTGLHLLILGGIALSQTWVQSVHAYIFVGEGCFLIYCFFFQPAFGFVPWKDSDERKALLTQPEAVAQAQAVQAPGKEDETYAVPFKAKKATGNFSTIHGMATVKEKLLLPAKLILAAREADSSKPRNGVLLYGEPGNGKTAFAEALAGELQVPIIVVTYGEMSSQWIGNMPRVISNTFTYAKRCAPCVLFIDEIDSFIKSRDSGTATAEDEKITNTLLTEIVNLRGHQVVLMGATNFLQKLDVAAIREKRFDWKVEITPPDEEARIGILRAEISARFSKFTVIENDAVSVAKRWNGFSVARLLAVCEAIPDVMATAHSPVIAMKQWMLALREVQGRQGKLPGGTKSLSEMVLDQETRTALDLVASRLTDVARIEALGGTLPTGILFHGPSGTGKTAAARALAKDVGWAFLSVAGPDLLDDRGKLEKLFAEAKDIRPTIIFVDEAEDLLRNRQYSSRPDLVNKLLTIMDGAEDKVQDVVWIAATNNPDQIDPALLRSGRFTEKVLFTTPPQDQIPRHISAWLKARTVGLDVDIDVFDLAEALRGQTIADVEGVLQYALNSAISKTQPDAKAVIDKSDFRQALRVVLTSV